MSEKVQNEARKPLKKTEVSSDKEEVIVMESGCESDGESSEVRKLGQETGKSRFSREDRETSSPEMKDDGSEHSENSKAAEDGLRIPFPESPLGTGPGRGVSLGGTSAGRTPHFPPPVFMWCPTIGLPPWCPALFPPGFVYPISFFSSVSEGNHVSGSSFLERSHPRNCTVLKKI
ncbi:UNVERIFIED_CONTAM: hypothetical protein PYX00_001920 [Menopon gallinae]|uniref:Uncharacterized protein n=1 Tax=Menopon gallinae TaxID=328185 RepID=A0AAW2IGW4_9NEOP